jgi:hypothetical protein
MIRETLTGQQLIVRYAELKAQGVLFVGLKVGSTNSEWILEYYPREVEQGELV